MDGSSPFYQGAHRQRSENPIHGSVWMVQVLSNNRETTKKRESHARQCVDGSSPLYKACSLIKLPNPTHGSVWFVQVLSTKRTNFLSRELSRLVRVRINRSNLNHPHTAVRGIRRCSSESCW